MDNTEAIKIVNALKPFIQEWMHEWCHSCMRVKQMTVTTAPANGVIGVTEGFGEEITIPYSTMLQNAQVGDVVYCCWVADNQATMIAMWEGSMTQTQIPVDTTNNWDELWRNGNMTSSFSAKTVSIPACANYQMFLLSFKRSTRDSNYVTIVTTSKGLRYRACCVDGNTEANAGGYAHRSFRIQDTGVEFEEGATAFLTNNSYMIPYQVIGFRDTAVNLISG